ncbi:MAG: hypothetical protein U0T77_05795 [Chitinophagales bacterium]
MKKTILVVMAIAGILVACKKTDGGGLTVSDPAAKMAGNWKMYDTAMVGGNVIYNFTIEKVTNQTVKLVEFPSEFMNFTMSATVPGDTTIAAIANVMFTAKNLNIRKISTTEFTYNYTHFTPSLEYYVKGRAVKL